MEDEIKSALEWVVARGADFADIRVEMNRTAVIDLRDGTFREMSFGIDEGFGVRVLRNGAWGFASSNDLSRLKETVEEALRISNALSQKRRRAESTSARGQQEKQREIGDEGEEERERGEGVSLAPVEVVSEHFCLKPRKDFEDVDIEEKKGIVKDAYKVARGHSPLVKSVSVLYMEGYERKIYANSEGSFIVSETPAVFFRVRAFASKAGMLQEGRESVGAVAGLEIFQEDEPNTIALKAADKAVRLLDAELPPAGALPVVMDNKLTGVFMHEALGHAAEADHVLRGESILRGKLHEEVAAEALTVADDPTIECSFGFFKYDDEGVKARRKEIIRNGVLVSFLHTRETAFRLNASPTGNARASDYDATPIVRMSNIVVEPRDWRFEEMLEDIKEGIYAKGMRGGEVDTVKGEFQFSAEEAFLIQKGELTKRLKNVSLSGKTLETLKNIDAVGRDMRRGSIGFCGKEGQEVPVAEFAPHIRVKKILVGGASK
ncbi:MAG: TldD/PmbA family protein [Candidatus Methanospirare jalkutatii]|nr:TldD/PmbA family protein [Candidatus Methanospirare jalkutatii]